MAKKNNNINSKGVSNSKGASKKTSVINKNGVINKDGGIDNKDNANNEITETTAVEKALFDRVSAIIENRKLRAGAYANREVTLMYWEIGRYINSVIISGERAAYGKKILSELATKLAEKYGTPFQERNIYRMTQFAAAFEDDGILSELATKLSWSHFVEILPLKTQEARLYYANDAANRHLGTKELRNQISRKAYERTEISNLELSIQSAIPFNIFKDPYILDTLGLKDNYLEADLEKAILKELESFILEFGHGFAFVERQKRMIIDGEDFALDLLFYHRILKRLIAVELKVGRFKALYKGQMELYLKWLDKYERAEDENTPIGIILCTTASREQIELLELEKSGIAVAEYWTELPTKTEFEKKLQEILAETKERLNRRNQLPSGKIQKQIEYFWEPKDEEEN